MTYLRGALQSELSRGCNVNMGRFIRCLVVAWAVTAVPAFAQTGKTEPKKSEPKVEPKKAEPVAKESRTVDIRVDVGGGQAQVDMINQLLEKSWKDNKIVHADRCTDYEFIRRASLDIIGRIAKIEEINRFLADPPERRRSLLIERLLESDEYPQNWANLWTVLLLTRSGTPRVNQEQLNDWLVNQLTDPKSANSKDKMPDWSRIVTDLIAGQGETNENGNVNFILAHLGEEIKQNVATD